MENKPRRFVRLRRLYAIGVVLVTLACSGSTQAPNEGRNRPKNVIMIVVDTFRADHLGALGHHRDTTPNLDQLAAESVLFTQAYSATSWTMPSLASYMTGVYPSVHRLLKAPHDIDQNALSEEFVTLAEALRDAGLRTASITAQPWISERTGLTQGFDEVRTVSNAADPNEARELTAEVIEWLEQSGDTPFFLYAHYMGPHAPYDAPEGYRGRYTRDLPLTDVVQGFHQAYATESQVRAYAVITGKAADEGLSDQDIAYLEAEYDEKLAFTDAQLGNLFSWLRDSGLLEETLVIVAADHGEAFFEHQTVFHGQHLHQELLHVPLIMRLPGSSASSLRVNAVAELIDIYPTILELLGAAAPPHIQGRSLMPLVQGGPGDGIALGECFGFRITTDGWSSYHDYIPNPEDEGAISTRALYDLMNDPLEQREVSADRRDVIARHERMARQLWIEMGRSAEYWQAQILPAGLDEDTERRLRSLGYLR
jgi:choline-sulfatase